MTTPDTLPIKFTCHSCLADCEEVEPTVRQRRYWCERCAADILPATDEVHAARLRLRAAEAELRLASADYRDAIAKVRKASPSERAMARALGLSQTAVRDLLRTERRATR